jgi:Ras-related protein Rab-2A
MDANVILFLIGNKWDLSQHRVITTDEGVSLARKLNWYFMETSAKTAYNVEQAFIRITTAAYKTIRQIKDKIARVLW